jgi:hypothetical protein
MLDKLFHRPLLPVTTAVVLSGILWGLGCALRSRDGMGLVSVWGGSLMTVGRISGPVGAIIGRLIGRSTWDEQKAGGFLGIILGLLFGLTIGVLTSRCAYEPMRHSLNLSQSQARNIAGVIGGLFSGAAVGLVATYLPLGRHR